ncbi:hypothetical protein N7533_009554 [Penicillium manginii]|uniref:uncharacterized protein n=1 Tax=Penicillium manginii TaxID=203109 RepID=UPI002547011C|nr:uncharacterized protein N7533_009554 [Penicillium manginii]KAJ5744684.1 hypothetical protein N7533_009554 [Penicillium manginii]
MNPYLSWAILLVVAGGLGWYYTNGAAPKAKAIAPVPLEKAQVAPKKPKRKTKPSEPTPAKKSEVKTVISPPTTEDEQPEEEIDPREMARRQTAIKNGIPQTTASSTKNKKKKQQKKAAQLEVGSHASSTTGAEADDDLSPAVNATVPSAGDVDDMIETPAAAAAAKVLRVTGDLPVQAEKKTKKEAVPEKNKKARAHQRKNEERKEQARLDEQDRQKKLEQHRRNIPELQATWSQSHANNAWENKTATNGVSKPAPAPAASNVQLLDTFSPQASGTNEWEQGLPTEEVQEQMAKAADADDAWTQVKTKKGGNKKENKKGGKTDESVSETSASEAKPTPVTSAPAPVKPRVTITPTYLPDLRSREKGHPLDSDWAA